MGAQQMLTGEIRNKVDKIWTDMWAGGISNPLTVIEQLTYLMFIRSLDEKELENERVEALSGEVMPKNFPPDEAGQAMRWSKFKTKDSRMIYDIVGTKVFPFIKAMNGANSSSFSRYMQDAMFLVPTPQVLQKIITGLDELYEHDIKDLDMQGDVYEYMLGKLATAGQHGWISGFFCRIYS
jgi:type I restriction enzyme M protein